jgi:purine-binding chemotaxis protein CheW
VSQASPKNKTDEEELLQISCFYLDKTLFGVDINLVQEINEVVNITQVPLSPDYVLGIMNLRGQIVTVIDQCRKLGFNPSGIRDNSRVIIVKSQSECIGLLVDKITEVITVNRNRISTPPSNIKGVQGRFFQGVIQTDRQELLALLDVETVLEDE